MPGWAGPPGPATPSAESSNHTPSGSLPSDVVEVRVRQPVSLEELSTDLSVEEGRLERLNAVPRTHRFQRGEWVRIPATSRFLLDLVASLDPKAVRHGDRSLEPVLPTANSRSQRSDDHLLAAIPTDSLEVRVRQPVSLDELSSDLSVERERLASLNAVPPTHRFHPGDWLRIPTSSSFLLEQVLSLDAREVRDSAPQLIKDTALPSDPSISSLAQQLISLDQRSLRYSFGRAATPSYSGAPVNRLHSSSAGDIDALLGRAWVNAPTVVPRSSGSPDVDELIREGAIAPNAQVRRRESVSPLRLSSDLAEICQSGAMSTRECTRAGVRSTYGESPSARELALLERMRSGEPYSYQPAWRRFGLCKYDWKGWRLHSHGVRTTLVSCDDQSEQWAVGVSCQRLMVATRQQDGQWGAWNRPAGPDSQTLRGQDEMVAALCANAIGQ